MNKSPIGSCSAAGTGPAQRWRPRQPPRSRKVVQVGAAVPGIGTSVHRPDQAAIAPADPAAAAARHHGQLDGCLEQVSRSSIRGWARDSGNPGCPVRLRVLAGGAVVADIVADRYRADLATAGFGLGRHGFAFTWPAGLPPDIPVLVEIRQIGSNATLAGSPRMLAPTQPDARPIGPATGGRGFLDRATRERVCGWARDEGDPDVPVELVICDNGTPVARVLANRFRSDLPTALSGTGRHAFEVSFPAALCPLTRHVISVKRARDGTDLVNSPTVIEAAGSFDAGARAAIADAVTAATTAHDVEQVLSFLAAQTERLRQQQADADTGRNQLLASRVMQRRLGPPVPAAASPVAPTATGPGAAPPAIPAPRILVIAEDLPAADPIGAVPTIVRHMQDMLALTCAVSFVAAGRLDATHGEIAPLLQRGITCCRAPVYTSVEDVLRRQGDGIDVVYLHGTDVAARYAALVRAHSPRAKVIYSVPELRHARPERPAVMAVHADMIAARRLRLAECHAAWSADAVIMQSAADASLLRRAVPQARIHIMPADTDADPVGKKPRRAAGGGLAFIGDLTVARRASVLPASAGAASPPHTGHA